MSRDLTALFALYKLSPGRRIYALTRLRALAKQAQLASVVAAVEPALSQDRRALELDAKRLGPGKGAGPTADDVEVDRKLAMIHKLLDYYAVDHPEAASLQRACFPAGLAEHVNLPYVDQAAANERVLDLLEGEAHGEWIEAHGLRPLSEDLRGAHDRFVAALHLRDSDDRPSWPEVKAARARGGELYLEALVQALAATAEDPELRAKLIAPILDQDEQVRAYRRKRRRPAEVDPDTGEALEPGGDQS